MGDGVVHGRVQSFDLPRSEKAGPFLEPERQPADNHHQGSELEGRCEVAHEGTGEGCHRGHRQNDHHRPPEHPPDSGFVAVPREEGHHLGVLP